MVYETNLLAKYLVCCLHVMLSDDKDTTGCQRQDWQKANPKGHISTVKWEIVFKCAVFCTTKSIFQYIMK